MPLVFVILRRAFFAGRRTYGRQRLCGPHIAWVLRFAQDGQIVGLSTTLGTRCCKLAQRISREINSPPLAPIAL